MLTRIRLLLLGLALGVLVALLTSRTGYTASIPLILGYGRTTLGVNVPIQVDVTGAVKTTGGGGGGTIGGSIAANQIAFGTGVNTIGGSANAIFTDASGLNLFGSKFIVDSAGAVFLGGQPEPDLSCCDGPTSNGFSSIANGVIQSNWVTAGTGTYTELSAYASTGTVSSPATIGPDQGIFYIDGIAYANSMWNYVGTFEYGMRAGQPFTVWGASSLNGMTNPEIRILTGSDTIAITASNATLSGTIQTQGYESSDGTAGVTSGGFKNGLNVSPKFGDVGTATLLEGAAQTAPSAPAANNGILFYQITGGKMQVAARFPSGAVQILAQEP